MTHVIGRGKHTNKINKKQEWSEPAITLLCQFIFPRPILQYLTSCCHDLLSEHQHYDYSCDWHYKFGKNNDFVTDKMWKDARAISKEILPGFARLLHILKLSKMAAGPYADGDGPKYTRQEDMLFSVFAMMGVVGGKVPLSLFNNHSFETYLHHLNPKNCWPHWLEQNHILKVMIVFAQSEFKKIVDELVNDFWSKIANSRST